MTEKFDLAAMRHWKDAQVLEREERLANADHLIGFAAECAIKWALVQVGVNGQQGELRKEFRKHINTLWDLILMHNIQNRSPDLAAVLRTRGVPNPFMDWSVDQRYGGDDIVAGDAFQKHRDAAVSILSAVGLYGVRLEN